MEPGNDIPISNLPVAALTAQPPSPLTSDASPTDETISPAPVPPATGIALDLDDQSPPRGDPPSERSNPLHDTVEAIKVGSLRLAAAIKQGTHVTGHTTHAAAPDHFKEASAVDAAAAADNDSTTLARIRATAVGLSARAKEQSSRLYIASVKSAVATADGIRRFAVGEPLQALCRAESSSRPLPQLVLACCAALAAGGLAAECVFKHEPPPELVDRLAAAVGSSVGVVPPGTSPHAVAALLKRFLLSLPEPLLTYRLLPAWLAAADSPPTCVLLLPQLPAANANVLKLLLQTCHYINEQAAENEMDAQALAEVLAPCVAWKPGAQRPAAAAAPVPSSPWGGLQRLLSGKAAGEQSAAGAAASDAGGPTDGKEAAGGDAREGGAVAGAAPGTEVGTRAAPEAAGKSAPLDGADVEAVVAVLEWMISNYPAVAASSQPAPEPQW